ncbi:AraC family transcriptional regulator [Dysgonomonas sp. 520]|uniref:AraC family transcriptional regulator n=1 Tax=Dysgonomonas sp. 520 TaxID=2302931 RepID=UPI0013D21902|nr:AraC family transcriptional regulator [Dysgonomonas sp. 520]NDW08668.1 AraC family transcriptional regulator [Dysgonomonas sp. 520]
MIIDNLNLVLLNVGYSELNASWNWKNISSPFARIYYVTGGEAKTYINGKAYTLTPGNLYLTPPFTLHDDESDSFFSLYYIHFYEKTYNKESVFDKLDFPVELNANTLDSPLIERLLEINPERHLHHIDPRVYDNTPSFSKFIADNYLLPIHIQLETRGILYQIMAKFMGLAQLKSRYKDIRIDKCLRYIHENTDKNVELSQLTDISCITKDHLIRIFKKETGYTPIKYINIKKIERAQLLLLTTNMSIADVALELSIDNVSYFNRLFKQYTNLAPSQYRNNKIDTSI